MSDWCKVYKEINEVKIDNSLSVDFRKEAIDIVFNYIDSYKEYCSI
jgi:hypothetical protein